MGEVATLGIIAPQLFVVGMVFYNLSEYLCVPIKHQCLVSVQECVLMWMSPPAVVAQVLLATLVSAASCQQQSLIDYK